MADSRQDNKLNRDVVAMKDFFEHKSLSTLYNVDAD